MADKIKSGIETSEHAHAKSAGIWGVVAMVLGIILSTGATIVSAFGTDTKVAIIGGAVIAVAGVVQKTLVTLGYIKGRSDVKSGK